MSISKIKQVKNVLVVGLPGTPATLVSKELHKDLYCICFKSGKRIAGQIRDTGHSYIVFENALTHETGSFNHDIISSIDEVHLFELISDVTEHPYFNNKGHDKILRREFYIVSENQTVDFVNGYTSDATALYSEDLTDF